MKQRILDVIDAEIHELHLLIDEYPDEILVTDRDGVSYKDKITILHQLKNTVQSINGDDTRAQK